MKDWPATVIRFIMSSVVVSPLADGPFEALLAALALTVLLTTEYECRR